MSQSIITFLLFRTFPLLNYVSLNKCPILLSFVLPYCSIFVSYFAPIQHNNMFYLCIVGFILYKLGLRNLFVYGSNGNLSLMPYIFYTFQNISSFIQPYITHIILKYAIHKINIIIQFSNKHSMRFLLNFFFVFSSFLLSSQNHRQHPIQLFDKNKPTPNLFWPIFHGA